MKEDRKKSIIKEASTILAANGGLFKAEDIYTNVIPHPYTIGSGHVVYASDHHWGKLNEEVIREYEKKQGGRCAQRGCTLIYDEHTHEHVLLVSLTQDMTNQEANKALFTLKPLLEREGLAGIGFLNLNKEYKILKELHMPEQFGIPCPCGSGEVSYILNDARGIPCGRVCEKCEEERKAQFSPEIFEDGCYECDEPIEPEAW